MLDGRLEIRSIETPDCYLCGRQGKYLYVGLTDRLFGAPGIWNLKQCQNALCGLIWLDPMPKEEDISLAYRCYYTHFHESDKINTGGTIYMHNILRDVLFRAARLINVHRTQYTDMYLGGLPPGRLLEVGCGAGSFLDRMRKKGWQVEGIDIDPIASQSVWHNYGIPVRTGRIEENQYEESSFDAVTMKHVIEHVHDPIRFLKDCLRVVKPGGRLVLVTPNSNSYGHNRFTSNWRGLEPPRHLYLFNENTLIDCIRKAGFTNIKAWPTRVNAASIYIDSQCIKITNNYDVVSKYNSDNNYYGAAYFVIMELLLSQFKPWIGEEIVLQVIK